MTVSTWSSNASMWWVYLSSSLVTSSNNSALVTDSVSRLYSDHQRVSTSCCFKLLLSFHWCLEILQSDIWKCLLSSKNDLLHSAVCLFLGMCRTSGLGFIWLHIQELAKKPYTRMWANAQRDGRPAEHRWRPLFNAAKFGWRPLLQCRAVS